MYWLLGLIAILSLILTPILWRTGVLRACTEPRALAVLKEEASGKVKLDNILEVEIPSWMAVPSFSYAVCFLLVCVGIAAILMVLSPVIQALSK